MIKLLALDLDGTTLNTKGKVSDANRDAIRAAEDAGVLVTIATGRRFRDAQPIGLELGLNAPMITHNGALIKYADTGKTVEYSLLSDATSLEIVSVGKSFGGDALVSADPLGLGTMLYDRVSDDNVPLMKYIRWSETLHGVGTDISINHVPRLEDAIHEHDVIHISFSGGCQAMAELAVSLGEEFGANITILSTVYTQIDFTLLDILPPDASKGHSVARVAELNGIEQADVMAIGDNFNDLHMLEFAGTPVVMGNAEDKLHTMGEFYTTLSNDESGVAAAIERFIFNRENI